MGLKLLHSADWHLDSPFVGFSPEQRELLRRAQRELPGLVADLCRRENCDLVLLAGDLLDGACSPETLERLRDSFARMDVPVLIAPGNHDYLAPGSPWKEETWPENVHIFPESLSSIGFPDLDCRVWGAGYRSMDCPALLEGFRAEGPETYQIGLIHGDPVQLRSPCCPVTAAQVRDSGLDYLALGHIHKAGSFRAGRTLCAWPGVPMGRGWDETGEKGLYITEIGHKASAVFVELDTPRFYRMEVDTDRENAENCLPAQGNDHFYRVTLTGSGKAAPEEWCCRFPNLELTDRREAPGDIWETSGEDTLEGLYFRLLREKLEGADPETEAVIRQAAEISRKLLRGREVAL